MKIVISKKFSYNVPFISHTNNEIIKSIKPISPITYKVGDNNEEIKGSKVKFNQDGLYSVLLTHDASKITKGGAAIIETPRSALLHIATPSATKTMPKTQRSSADLDIFFILS